MIHPDARQMKGLIVIAALALTGCAATPDQGAPLRSECIDTGEVASFTVMIRDPRRIQEMFAHTPRDATTRPDFVSAFTGTNARGQMTLVLPPLRGQRDHERLTVWGHELAHIVCGSFHDHQDGVEQWRGK